MARGGSSFVLSKNVGLGILTAVVTAGILYYTIRVVSFGNDLDLLDDEKKKNKKSRGLPDITTTTPKPITKSISPDVTKPSTTSTDSPTTEDINKRVEEIDQRGKTFYKKANYLDAASCFTQALDLLGSSPNNTTHESRQVITLTNNRSAMYEKAGMGELAIEDCDKILQMDVTHQKARLRKLRVLESQGDRWMDALVEVCALQLRFMTENRENLRLGVPVNPPVDQSKVEDLMGKLLPQEIERHMETVKNENNAGTNKNGNPLPSVYTILQLLQSFSGYNAWMASAAKGGTLTDITEELDNAITNLEKARLLFKRGRRYTLDNLFQNATDDFDAAYELVQENALEDLFSMQDEDNSVTYCRLLEWVAMGRHLRYNLDGASKCYERCSELEPTNAEILVKRAGVKMDGSDHTAALTLFTQALDLDPSCVDALLHRANLFVIQQQPLKAKEDLENVVKLQPNHLLAYLRLATVYMSMGEDKLDDANTCLEKAEAISGGNSSEVHSYRGEMHFARGEMTEARAEFTKATECDLQNPTPHVNAALAVMNSPSPNNGPPDIPEAVKMLEKALKIDPQFHAAYVHLGQLKLTTATNLSEARDVVSLYDQGLRLCCRTPEEVKDIISFRILTVAQIDAATALKMETLNMQ